MQKARQVWKMSEDEKLEIEIPHIHQSYNWDCGLACVKMILEYLKIAHDDFGELCQRLKFGTSIWTIDLVQIMKHYRVPHHFTTITLGVDNEYSQKSFYKNHFSVDQVRVNTIFEQAETLGLSVEKKSVTMPEITSHLGQQLPLITLVDNNRLQCIWCTDIVSCAGSCIGNCLGRLESYQGHFIVVCGYNKSENVIFYKNPGNRRERTCCCTVQSFEKARKAHGTDEDILFILADDKVMPDSQKTELGSPDEISR